jgi:hypothetical protein
MVHDLGAALDHRPQLLAVDGLGDHGRAMANEPEMLSIGTFASDSSDTKLCRSSRGAHSLPASPAASTTLRKSRRTLRASSGLPVRVTNTRQGHPVISA